MEERIKVSVITVSKNSQDTIRDTIESVLNQTYKNIEYWIIDGLSNDCTMMVAQEYIEKFEKKGIEYHIVSEVDDGIYDAMNKGIIKSTGEIIGIINSDDWYEPQAVECAVENYIKHKYDLFYADIRIIGDENSFVKKSKDSKIRTSRYWNHPTTFIPRHIYNKFLYKNESIHDDWDLILRIRKNQCKVCVVNEVLANFRRNGISHEKSMKKAWDRVKVKYHIYRQNGYSRWYFIECFGIELAKTIF